MPPSISSPGHLVPIEQLSQSAFEPFGTIIANPATHGSPQQGVSANQGSALKYADMTDLTNHYVLAPSRIPAKPAVTMFVCSPRKLDHAEDAAKQLFKVEILERHPFTSQTFVPLGLAASDGNTAYLVVVAPTLSSSLNAKGEEIQPPYPRPAPRRKRSLKERLLGGRPNPFTNDYTSRTTPPTSSSSSLSRATLNPKGLGMPDLHKVRAFIARGDQAVTYGPGTWHAPMVVLGARPVDFVVVQYSNGVPLEDCQEVKLRADGGQGVAVVVEEDVLSPQLLARAKL